MRARPVEREHAHSYSAGQCARAKSERQKERWKTVAHACTKRDGRRTRRASKQARRDQTVTQMVVEETDCNTGHVPALVVLTVPLWYHQILPLPADHHCTALYSIRSVQQHSAVSTCTCQCQCQCPLYYLPEQSFLGKESQAQVVVIP